MRFAMFAVVAFVGTMGAFGAVHNFGPKDKIRIHSEPAGYDKYVVVSQAHDRVTFDCREAFSKGMENLVCELPTFNDPELAGDDVLFEVSAGSVGHPGRIMLYLTMTWKTDGRHTFHALKSRSPFVTSGLAEAPIRCVACNACKPDSYGYTLRFDFRRTADPKKGIYFFESGRVARRAEIKEGVTPKKVKPEVTMYIPFDGSAAAKTASGNGKPLVEKGLSYEPGVKGQAVRISSANRSILQYAYGGNVAPERGSIALWLKRDKLPTGAQSYGRWIVAANTPFDMRCGTGARYLWMWGAANIRLDPSDDCDAFVSSALACDGEWHHVVACWNEAGAKLFIDGAQALDDEGGITHVYPLERARQPYAFSKAGANGAYESFYIGSWRGQGQINGLVDELKFYSAALTKEEVQALYRADGGKPCKRVDYAAISARRGGNPYVGEVQNRSADVGERTLVASAAFDEKGVAELKKNGAMFEVVGLATHRKTADGVGYIELGGTVFDRMALGLDISTNEPLYEVEIDYPDNAKRTMDLIVQTAFSPLYETKKLQNYEMQVGLITGGDYPISGKVRTHRCLYWANTPRIVFEAMTARANEPAAIAAFRLYRINAKKLPPAKIRPGKRRAGWGRTLGWYFEDPSVNYEFGVKDYAATPELCLEMADKIAATMKYQGLDMFAFPGAWYNGMIDTVYNPHALPPDFITGFYTRFDREGLGFVPLINQESHSVSPESLTYDMIESGAVYDSPFMIGATGRPCGGIVRDSAIFNICHPKVQKYYEEMFDRFIADGVKHPSFRGIGLHVKHSSMAWLGLIGAGYNDYMIDGFTRDTGIRVPVDRKDPRRGKAAYEWLMANAYDKWVEWRCRQVSGFWVKMAAKLRAARPDLKLWIQNIADLDPIMDRFTSPDYMRRIALEGGLDREIFAREAPNVIMGQTCLPADYRYTHPGWYYATEQDYECQRTYHQKPYYWDFIEGADYPLVHLHDRYWESHPGDADRNRDPARRFKANWFKEVKWRVSTLNAPGPYAMEHYAVPLRFRDVLGFTKGGYLIGTYGMEDYLVPFARAFRALPAVTMATLPGGDEFVRLRHAEVDGKSWSYVVNTGIDPVRVTVDFPAGTLDLVTGEKMDGRKALELGPYELRSFGSKSGKPAIIML